MSQSRDALIGTTTVRCSPGRPVRLATLMLGAFLWSALLWAILVPRVGHAQENVGVYTVAPGDTLSAIAARFEVPMEALVQLNAIADPALIQVGQELLIPTPSAALALGVAETSPLYAKPGESLAALAVRTDQNPELLAALNALSQTARLWPGQPVAAPADREQDDGLRFGAVTALALPAEILQGRTGRLQIQADRAISLAVDWNGLRMPVTTGGEPTATAEALLPAPALIEPGAYTVTVAYTTARGVAVTRTWPVEIGEGGYGFQTISVPPEKQATLDATTIATETELLRAVYAPVTADRTLRTSFIRPIGEGYATTSPFGVRRSYNDGALASFHSGQDFGAPEGTPVFAPAAGVVALARSLPIRGKAVVLDHGQGVYSGYWHLSDLAVAPDQPVAAGDVIGLVGNTGRSTGAHLHWELRIAGVAVDPMQFLTEPIFTP